MSFWLVDAGLISPSRVATACVLPCLYLASALAMYLVIVVMKWVIIGRYKKHVAPLWSHFVWRSEFITAMYESAAVPALIGGFTGTPFIGPLLSLLGARIGSRVYLETTHLTEFDLVRVGNDAAVGGTCSLQTHLFEDRVMKMDVVKVDSHASIGPRSVVLYGCHVGKGAEIDGLSLVMKGEHIPDNTRWRGIPSTFIGSK
jgi:non-ribosomal peptide synthetase-like protein